MPIFPASCLSTILLPKSVSNSLLFKTYTPVYRHSYKTGRDLCNLGNWGGYSYLPTRLEAHTHYNNSPFSHACRQPYAHSPDDLDLFWCVFVDFLISWTVIPTPFYCDSRQWVTLHSQAFCAAMCFLAFVVIPYFVLTFGDDI